MQALLQLILRDPERVLASGVVIPCALMDLLVIALEGCN